MPGWLDRLQRVVVLITMFLYSAGYATIGLLLVLLSAVSEGIIRRRVPWDRSPLDRAILAFLAVFLLAGYLSPFRPLAVGSIGLAALTVYLAFGVPHRVLRRAPEFLIPLSWAWVIGGAVAGAWALTLRHPTVTYPIGPAVTPALGQNAVGTTMLAALIVAVGILAASTSRWRLLVVAALPVLALGLAYSYTRGAWLGAAAGLVMFVLLGRSRRVWIGVALLLAVGVVAVGIAAVTVRTDLAQFRERLTSIGSVRENVDRVYLLQTGLAIFRDHPILGTGLNTFATVYPGYRRPEDPNMAPGFAHNIFLNMAAEGGIFGLLAFLAVLVAGLAAGARWYRRVAGAPEALWCVTVLSAFVGMMVHQLFDGTLLSVHLGVGMWLLLGASAAGGPPRA